MSVLLQNLSIAWARAVFLALHASYIGLLVSGGEGKVAASATIGKTKADANNMFKSMIIL